MLTRIVVKKLVSNDCEARDWTWEETDETYEELVEKLAEEYNPWFRSVALVEKRFDEESFTIKQRTIKQTVRKYKQDEKYQYLRTWIGVEEIKGEG